MEKVLCNALYKVSIKVVEKEMGDVSLELGLFEDEEDALCAGMLVKKIMDSPEDYNFVCVENPQISREYIPEKEMNKPNVASRFHFDLNHFVLNNGFVIHYMDKYGIGALESIVYDCVEEVDSNDQNKKPSQQGEE